MVPTRSVAILGIAVVLFFVYVAVGYGWAIDTTGLTEGDILFHADTTRVVSNETSVSHVQGRTVLHPLHVAMTIPLGLPLAAFVHPPELVAVLLTAAFAAGCLYNLDWLLRRCTRLPLFDRALFVLLLGVSAGHFTFGSVPETHVISAFFLSLAARHLAARGEQPVELHDAGPRGWLKLFQLTGMIHVVLSAGALVTNALLGPVVAFLRLPRHVPWRRRVLLAGGISIGAIAVLVALHLAQRFALYTSAPSATHGRDAPALASFSESNVGTSRLDAATTARDPSSRSANGASAWLRQRFERELGCVSWRPARPLELGLATLFFNVYAPRFETYRLPDPPSAAAFAAVRMDYLRFDLRLPGIVGSVAWALVLVGVFGTMIRRRVFRKLVDEPVLVFVWAWLGLYFGIFNFYHVYPIALSSDGSGNDVFLFAPNLVLPLLFLVAVAYDRSSLSDSSSGRLWIRAGLAIAVLAALVNTSLHVSELMSLYPRA